MKNPPPFVNTLLFYHKYPHEYRGILQDFIIFLTKLLDFPALLLYNSNERRGTMEFTAAFGRRKDGKELSFFHKDETVQAAKDDHLLHLHPECEL